MTAAKSIVADNVAGDLGDDCLRQAGSVALDHTLVGAGLECATSLNATLVGDAGLGELTASQDHRPEWFPLRRDSVAVDAGDSGLIPANIYEDQAGSDRVIGEEVDLGAFELPSLPIFADGFESSPTEYFYVPDIGG